MNVKHLPEMLETFIGWGVKEFDLLHVIPFGNAWSDAREHLFYDIEDNLEHLQRAFAYSRRPDVHVWLNRFPPPFAEGFEDLIQDPYKLNDEVRGRREEFERYLSHGEKLGCREPERCARCYLAPLCDGLDDVLEVRRADDVEVLRVDCTRGLPSSGRLPRARRLRVVGRNLAEAEAVARAASPEELELELEDYAGLASELDGGSLFGKRLVRAYAATSREAERLLEHGSFEVVVMVSKETISCIRGLDPPPARLALAQPDHDLASDALANDVDLAAFFAAYRHPVPVENVPACLLGRAPRRAPRVLDLAMLGPDARVDMPAFTRRFVAEGFRTKAVRCASCAENDRCRGVHVNWVRAHGFAPLAPLREAYPPTEA
jgi:hypothetical protein